MLTDHDAFGHPAYEAGVAKAVRRARENPGACFSVYYDGPAIYVSRRTWYRRQAEQRKGRE